MTDKTVIISARISKEDRDYLSRQIKGSSFRDVVESLIREIKNGRIEIHNGAIRIIR